MAALSPNNPPCVFKVYANFSAAGILTVQRTSGANNITEYLYGNQQLAANVPYTFYVAVDSGETIDFEFSATCTINKFTVTELDMSVSHATDTPIHAIGADYVGLFKSGQTIGQSPFTLQTDNVGILKDTKIPNALEQDASGAIYHVIKTDLVGLFKANQNIGTFAQSPITLATDSVGLLKDSKIGTALQQDGSGALYHIIKADNVGLFKAGQNIGTFSQSPITLATDSVGIAKDSSLKPIAKGNIVKSAYTANAAIF